MPVTLFITFSNTGTCPALDGLTLTLTWNTFEWNSGFITCSGSDKFQIHILCPGGACSTGATFTMTGLGSAANCCLVAGSPAANAHPAGGCTCSPVNWVYSITPGFCGGGGSCSCCGGAAMTATVTQ